MTTNNKFNKWLDTYVEEAEINLDRFFEFENQHGYNMMPVGVVIEYVKQLPADQQYNIKNTIVKIDFMNGDVYHFLEYMAKGISKFN